MLRALIRGLTIGAACVLAQCSPFSGSDHAAPPTGDSGTTDASPIVVGDAAASGPFCKRVTHTLCMDWDDGILAPSPFTATGDAMDLSVADRGQGKALVIDAPMETSAANGRTADLVALAPAPAKVTFGFTLTLLSSTQPDHVEVAGFEIQSASLPFVWVIIQGKNFVIADGASSANLDTLYADTLPPPGTPMELEVAFTMGSATSVVVRRDGQTVSANQPTKLTSLVVDAQQKVACSAGMHYRYTPAGAASYQMDNVYFDF